MGLLDVKFEWKEFLADIYTFFKAKVLPPENVSAFFAILAGFVNSAIAGNPDHKTLLVDIAKWAKATLTKEEAMELSKIVEKRLVFSGTMGAIAEGFDGTLIDELFEKGYDSVLGE